MIYSFGEWDWGSEDANMVKYEAIVDWLETHIGPHTGTISRRDYRAIESDVVFNRAVTQFLMLSGDSLLTGDGASSWKGSLKYDGVVCHYHPKYQTFFLTTRHIDGNGPCHVFVAIRDDAIIIQLKLLEVESPNDLLIKVINDE